MQASRFLSPSSQRALDLSLALHVHSPAVAMQLALGEEHMATSRHVGVGGGGDVGAGTATASATHSTRCDAFVYLRGHVACDLAALELLVQRLPRFSIDLSSISELFFLEFSYVFSSISTGFLSPFFHHRLVSNWLPIGF